MDASSRNIRGLAPALAISAALLVSGCAPDGSVAGGRNDEALTVDHVFATGDVCTPTGKHAEHVAIPCATCHQCAGTVSFDAAAAGPTAAFSATAKTCSNVSCHTVPAGVFTFWKYDPDLEGVVPVYVPYGGPSSAGTPYWYAAPGMGCNACHGYPPKYGGITYPWHSGMHGSGISNGNTCQLCHPDATGAYVYGGAPSYVNTSGGMILSCPPGAYCSAPGTITNPTAHRNGTLDVAARFVSRCFGCH